MRTGTTQTLSSSTAYLRRRATYPTLTGSCHTPPPSPHGQSNSITKSTHPRGALVPVRSRKLIRVMGHVLCWSARCSVIHWTKARQIVTAIPSIALTAPRFPASVACRGASKPSRDGQEIAELSPRSVLSLRIVPMTSPAAYARSPTEPTTCHSARRGEPPSALPRLGGLSSSLSPRSCRFTRGIPPRQQAPKLRKGPHGAQ